MSEEELRSYRLTSMEEPTDKMLHAIMEQVAESARESSKRADAFKQQMMEQTCANIKKALKALKISANFASSTTVR